MTIRQLKTMINGIPEKYLDKEILPCHEDDDGESYCEDIVFDIGYNSFGICFYITTLQTEKTVKYHDDRLPWDKVEKIKKRY